MTRTHHFAIFETALGFCGIAWSDLGIVRFQLPTQNADATRRALLRRLPDAKPGEPTLIVAAVIDSARHYFAGERVAFSDIPLDLEGQDDASRKIYAAARRVGWGETTTYGTLAKELGAGWEGAKNVGSAMASNPVALIIPCHRVLAAGGKVGGFSAPGGASTKIRMLALEGVHIGPAQKALEF